MSGVPVHVPLPPPFPLRSPIPPNPPLTLPGLPLPSPVTEQTVSPAAPKQRARAAPGRRESNDGPVGSEKSTPVTVAQKGYVRFDDDGNGALSLPPLQFFVPPRHLSKVLLCGIVH